MEDLFATKPPRPTRPAGTPRQAKPKSTRPTRLQRPARPAAPPEEPRQAAQSLYIKDSPYRLSQTDISSIDLLNTKQALDAIEKEINLINFDDKMTTQELRFLELHFRQNLSKKKALISAGYPIDPEDTNYARFAKKIIEKHERHESDHKNIMRMLGVGEVALIAGLYKVACESTSEVAKVQAFTTLGKWIGMAKEVIEGAQGVTVIIKGPDYSDPATCLPSTPPRQGLPEPEPETRHPKPARPGQPVQIVR